MQQIIQWFDLGGQLKFSDTAPSAELMDGLKHIQGLSEKLSAVGIKPKEKAEIVVSGAEFLLEGLYAHKRIGRSEERVFMAPEKQRQAEKAPGREEFPVRNRRPYN
jgi:magnesium chelatase subunit I